MPVVDADAAARGEPGFACGIISKAHEEIMRMSTYKVAAGN